MAVAGAIVSSQPSLGPTQQQTSEKNYGEDHNEKGNITLWDRWFPESISIFNLFLVVFTGVLAFVGIFQLNALNRAEHISATSAQAAKKAAEAASDSVRAFVESERGRMFVSEIKLIKKDANDPQPTIDYSFVNVGRGTVIVIQASIERELIGLEIPRDVTYDPTKAYEANNAVGPGAFAGTNTKPVFLPPCAPFSTPLTADDYANIAAKKARILVKGFIRYRTGFDDIYRRNFAVVYGVNDYFSDVAVPGYNEEYREPKPK